MPAQEPVNPDEFAQSAETTVANWRPTGKIGHPAEVSLTNAPTGDEESPMSSEKATREDPATGDGST